ncbi:LPS-assembly protein LptD [bacterium HR21]|nr:LPS-assembly protein LptD [bacterium HR21]
MQPALSWNKLLSGFVVSLFLAAAAAAQVEVRTGPKSPGGALPHQAPPSAEDSASARIPLTFPAAVSDTVHPPLRQDAAELQERSGRGIDTVVTFAARDTMLFTASERRLRLRGHARLQFRNQELTAEVIELWLETAELTAEGTPERGSQAGTPIFREGTEEYRGERFRYSFRTRRGVVTGVTTQLGEGFYSGQRLKQVVPGIFYVQNGCYTTCDHTPPHFRFCASQMKLRAGDRLFTNALTLYVEEVPLFFFPFGLFFPNRGGRQSGILTPSFFFSAGGGVVLENLGYFLAPSEYWDAQFRVTLRTRQGAVFHTLLRYAVRGWIDGSAELSGGWTRLDLDSPLQPQWNIAWRHRQRITPQWDVQVNLQLSSPEYFRQVVTDIRQRVLGSLLSTFGSSYIFESGASLSLAAQREQNLLTGTHSGTLPQLTLTLPTWMPLGRWYALPEWLRQLQLDYTATALWSYRRSDDGTFSHQSFLRHVPSVRVSPKLGFVTLTPTMSYQERWYFRQLRQWMHPEDSTLVQERSAGFFREYSYSIGVSLSTRLYGIAALPVALGVQAFRHVLQPTVTLSYTPSFPQFYASYTDYRSGQVVNYSRFALDGGGFAPRQRQLRLDYRLLNSFELKPVPRDTAAVLPFEVFRLSLAGSYNPLADSLRLGDLSFDFSIPALQRIRLQGTGTATFYSEVPAATQGGLVWRRVNRLRIADGLFPLRLTSFRLQADFDGGGTVRLPSSPLKDSTTADFFGEYPTPLALPPLDWHYRVSASLRYEEPTRGQIVRGIDLLLGIGLRLGGWNLQANANLDVLQGQLITPAVSLVRDLHCWELRLEWYPLGTFRGYWLRFSPKASTLRDLKYEEKTIPGL